MIHTILSIINGQKQWSAAHGISMLYIQVKVEYTEGIVVLPFHSSRRKGTKTKIAQGKMLPIKRTLPFNFEKDMQHAVIFQTIERRLYYGFIVQANISC